MVRRKVAGGAVMLTLMKNGSILRSVLFWAGGLKQVTAQVFAHQMIDGVRSVLSCTTGS